MKLGVLSAMLGIGGFLFTACSSANQAGAIAPAQAAQPSGIIRSQSDLQRYLSATPDSAPPLGLLSSGARQRFLSNLTFNAAGVTGFRYDDLQNELTASQAYSVLALFGFQQDIAIIPHLRVVTSEDKRRISEFNPVDGDGNGDYPNYACASRATCAPHTSTICTHNC